MGTYGPVPLALKDGRTAVLRHLEPTDAPAFVTFHAIISRETQHTMQRPEDPATLEKSSDRFRRLRDAELDLMVGVFVGDELTGIAGFHNQWPGHPWVRHAMGFGMMVKRAYWGSGVAKALLEALFDHGARNGIRRIEGRVRATNDRGIRFYEKMGFQVEGTHPLGAIIDGREITELTIARVT